MATARSRSRSADDTVILSSSPERAGQPQHRQPVRQARVVWRVADVRVRGHAAREELRSRIAL
jgi:hypothetical protein